MKCFYNFSLICKSYSELTWIEAIEVNNVWKKVAFFSFRRKELHQDWQKFRCFADSSNLPRQRKFQRCQGTLQPQSPIKSLIQKNRLFLRHWMPKISMLHSTQRLRRPPKASKRLKKSCSRLLPKLDLVLGWKNLWNKMNLIFRFNNIYSVHEKSL